jgi:hypothetical protein
MQDIASVQDGCTAELVLVRLDVAVRGRCQIEYEKYFGKYGELAAMVTALVHAIVAIITKVLVVAIITAK